jgi:3D (Asp-Asp-Asp) domain-containing protein
MKRFAALLAFAACMTDADPALAASDPLGDMIATVSQQSSITAQWFMKATLYHAGAPGVGNRDAKGCTPVALRTAAVDRSVAPLGSLLFIKETVGVRMPDGSKHDGFWYASDTGGAIKGRRIDLYTGSGTASMSAIMKLNLATLTVAKVGSFRGCPPR